MTWQLGSFAILALALACGFAWYERSRPDARIVALVGALAAFAALGRIAFAALPNVKPTTDIVLISGYALGGAPGFVVGAVAGLTSNFFFGQGPWTPWQMAAWGVTGLIGAGLGLATRRRAGRWSLALTCTVTGFAFAVAQDIGDWVTYSDHSRAELGVYIGKGIGFDLIHAAGCLAFALAFGPALAHTLRRLDQRTGVVWRSASGAVVPAVVALATLGALGGGLALQRPAPARASSTPAGYLLAAQNADGGFGATPGSSSSGLYTGWAALGLAATGHNPQDVARGVHSVIGYIEASVHSLRDVGSLERTILAVRASGLSATSFGSVDLVDALRRHIRADGSVGEQVNLTSFAVLALRAEGTAPPAATVAWLARQADYDGGFNFATAGGASDVDDTGAALEALAGASGSAGRARSRAVAYLRRMQNRDGGFPSDSGAESNAQSTAFAVQGLIAAGVDPTTLHRSGAVSPVQFLVSLTGPDGHVHYSRSTDQTPVWVTAQAAMALAGKPLPIVPVPVLAGPAHHTRHGGAGAGATTRASATASRHRAGVAPPAAHHAKPSRPGVRRRRSLSAPRSSADWLPTGAAVLAALALAPVGV
jgi:energy-coupling factor transport system substrate-specific component